MPEVRESMGSHDQEPESDLSMVSQDYHAQEGGLDGRGEAGCQEVILDSDGHRPRLRTECLDRSASVGI